ncbi:MAG: hypothetical protein K1X75_07185 [Leptospirales bacterium]|nr:hypothetical protein [Leptospirales bacterium]
MSFSLPQATAGALLLCAASGACLFWQRGYTLRNPDARPWQSPAQRTQVMLQLARFVAPAGQGEPELDACLQQLNQADASTTSVRQLQTESVSEGIDPCRQVFRNCGNCHMGHGDFRLTDEGRHFRDSGEVLHRQL